MLPQFEAGAASEDAGSSIREPLKYIWPGLILLLALYVIIAAAHAHLAPLTTGPDELAHYEYVRFIADHGRLPLENAERAEASYKSDQPPLFHLIAALPVRWVDPAGPPFLKRVTDNPRRQLIERTRHAWGLYNTEDERWPYRAEVLRWQIGRWIAILFGAATVAVTYFIAHEVFRTRLLALAAAAVVAFIPRFTLTGSMLNYETLMAFFAALFLWVLVRMANSESANLRMANGEWRMANSEKIRPTSYALRPTFYALLLGLFAGLAITAKLSALILPLEIAIALWLLKRHFALGWAWWGRQLLLAGLATVVAVSWWFGFILVQFNTIAADGWWTGSLRPLIAADSSDATTNQLLAVLTGGEAGFTAGIENLDSGPPWEWVAILFRTFWAVGIEQVQPLGWLGLGLALILCLLAAWGLYRVLSRSGEQRHPATANGQLSIINYQLSIKLLLLHLTLPLLLPLIRYAVTFSLADTAQGRHVLFAAAPAFGILLVAGLVEMVNGQRLTVSRQLRAVATFLPGLFLLVWSGVQLWTMTWAYNPLLPVTTAPLTEVSVTRRIDQPLTETVTLIGYDQQQQAEMLRLDLWWQATAVSPVDYLTEVSLVDQTGTAQALWLGYPAGGRYPTRAWDVGDIVRDTIWLPLSGLATGPYNLRLNLRAATVMPDAPSIVLDEPFTLGQVTLAEPVTAEATTPQLWKNGQPLGELQTFQYRETILVTLPPVENGPARQVQIIGPFEHETPASHPPVQEMNDTAIFLVGPDWPTGTYQARLTIPQADGTVAELNTIPFQVIDRWQRQFDEPAMQQRVEANFANRIKLLGYDLAANRAEPGGGIPLTLYWQGLDWMGTDYTIFVKLLAADQSVHGGRDRLPVEGYSTLYWAPSEIITDPFGVPVDSDAPDGVYYLSVGLYEQIGEQAVSLPLVHEGQLLDTTSVSIGPIKIGDTAPGLTIDQADPQVTLNQPFGDGPNLTLLGYDLTNETGHPITNNQLPITNLHLKLYWQSGQTLSTDFTTFVHLRNGAGEVVAQQDQPPLNGAYPTSLWDRAEIIADEIIVPLPADLPHDTYCLFTGLYNPADLTRLSVSGNPANEVELTCLESSG